VIVLGLHFGHDASVAVVADGRVVNCVVRERLSRVKHALGLDAGTVLAALDDAGVHPREIDLCAVTSTQAIDLVSLTPGDLSLAIGSPAQSEAPCLASRLAERQGRGLDELLSHGFLDWVRQPVPEDDRYRHLVLRSKSYFPEHADRADASFGVLGAFDRPIVPKAWSEEVGLETLAARGLDGALDHEALRFGMHLPVVLSLAGHEVPGYLLHHHLAHAASVFYPSSLDESLILTHDGWRGLDAVNRGLFWWGEGSRLVPLAPHYLSVGGLYEQTGYLLGLGSWGQEGKLMGLAPYGRPTFFDRRWVGNRTDVRQSGVEGYFRGWFRHCVERAEAEGYDLAPLADPGRMTAAINADIAASTQVLFEETLLSAVAALRRLVRGTRAESDRLCLAGGTALNCPANSRIWREGGFATTVVPPWTDDSGLALGAALALLHGILGAPRAASDQLSPYLGRCHAGEVEAALAAPGLRVTAVEDAAAEAARDLAGGKVIAWYEGRSEVGPRALGHRSILADPRQADNWQRVNRIKGREAWRPLAPAVLEERAADWFEGSPLPSPHMLFTAQVRGAELPAITHLDGSARLQTVGRECGGYRRVFERFEEETSCPVVMNTSFNGPGEPIVESPAEAVAAFSRSQLDVLYLAGRRVDRPVR
jgi:carbamoyltransferase